MTATLALLVAILGASVLVLFLLQYQHSLRLLEWSVGFAAGLQGAQIAKVHVFTIMCALYVCFGNPAPNRRFGRCLLVLLAVGCLVASVPLGSLVNSNTIALQVIALALGACIVVLRSTPSAQAAMLYGLLAAAVLGSFIAVLQKAGLVHYTPIVDASGIARVHGFYHEPDWLGLYSAVGLLLLFFVPLRRSLQVSAGAILVAGLVLSGARGAWLSAATMGALAVALAPLRQRALGVNLRNGRMLVAGALIFSAVVLTNPGVLNSISDRLTGSSSQVSVNARISQIALLEQLARTAPWHGLGLSASGHVDVSGQLIVGASPSSVATNWILGWWVDAKYLAVPIIVLFIAAALLAATRVPGVLLGAVIIDGLVANAFLNPLPWFLLALCLAALDARPALLNASAAPTASTGEAGLAGAPADSSRA